MFKNVSIFRMLLLALAFLMTSCSTFRKRADVPPRKSPTQTHKTIGKDQKLRGQIASYAKTTLGSKYKYGGSSPSGFDCSGLTYFVFKRHNYTIPRTSSAQSETGKKIPITKARPGDLLFFNKGKGAKVNHVAMVISRSAGSLKVIHSTSSKGVIVQDINQSNYWKPRLLYARDLISK